MNVWLQQQLDHLRQRLADRLARRAELAADKDALARLDAINKEAAEHAFEPWQRLNP